jgi:uncharacterized protein YceH (UPF0502 family)
MAHRCGLPTLAVCLERRPGQKEDRYAQLLERQDDEQGAEEGQPAYAPAVLAARHGTYRSRGAAQLLRLRAGVVGSGPYRPRVPWAAFCPQGIATR